MRALTALYWLILPLGLAGCDDAAPAGGDAASLCLGAACRDAAPPECTRNADCPPGQGCDAVRLTCVPDGRPCTDRGDCLAGEQCLAGWCGLPTGDGGPDLGRLDLGVVDASALDASPLDRGPEDGGYGA
ncbi:MAG: hypothetical protein H6702_18990 [Myxococcales bacterium]|nr:hypothetical protein [Myxococcales bacterium]